MNSPPISIYRDTNCINARQRDQFVNELEKLYEQDKLLLGKTDTLDVELKRGKGYPLGLRKSSDYIEAGGYDRSDYEKIKSILTALFGAKGTNFYTPQEIGDAHHISMAIKHGGTHFITYEKKLLEKAKTIIENFGIKIVTPKNCLEEAKNLLGVGCP